MGVEAQLDREFVIPYQWWVSRFQVTHKLELRFHALLTDGEREVRFERTTMG